MLMTTGHFRERLLIMIGAFPPECITSLWVTIQLIHDPLILLTVAHGISSSG